MRRTGVMHAGSLPWFSGLLNETRFYHLLWWSCKNGKHIAQMDRNNTHMHTYKERERERERQQWCLNGEQSERDLPIGSERLLWKAFDRSRGRSHRGAEWCITPHFRLIASWKFFRRGNQSLPKALMTSWDCWRIHSESRMWRRPSLQQKLQEKRAQCWAAHQISFPLLKPLLKAQQFTL